MREARARWWVGAWACVLAQAAALEARAQSAAVQIESLSATEFAALRPLADRGAAVLVRDAAQGPRARVTVLIAVHAPRRTVYDTIANVEQYPAFMQSVDRLDVTSRWQNRVAFRLHTMMAVFSVETVATLHMVNDHRIDGEYIRSQLGPGSLRWDLWDGAPGTTYLSYTTAGDPSQGNWFLRQIALASPEAIAGMQVTYDVLLAMLVGQRAEALAGTLGVVGTRPQVSAGPLVAPLAGPWMALARGGTVVAGVRMNALRETEQTFVAMGSPLPVRDLCARLENVAGYERRWRSMRRVRVVSGQGNRVVFHARAETVFFELEGDLVRRVEPAPGGVTVWWEGASDGYVGDVQRWDLREVAGGGSLAMFSGGGDYARTGMLVRSVIDRVPWTLPGYSAAVKMLWIAALVN